MTTEKAALRANTVHKLSFAIKKRSVEEVSRALPTYYLVKLQSEQSSSKCKIVDTKTPSNFHSASTTTTNVIVQNSNGSSRNIAVAFKKCCKFFVTNRDFQKHEEDGIAM